MPLRRLSPILCAITVVAFVAGLGWGLSEYLSADRDAPINAHVDGTDAWGVHIALTAVALGWIIAGVWAHRTARAPWLVPPNPVGRPITAQWSALVPLTPMKAARGIIAAAVEFVVVYSVWRAGAQITGALDPRWTVNAWGGPGYLGALYCHYLDLALLIGVASIIQRRILPKPAAGV